MLDDCLMMMYLYFFLRQQTISRISRAIRAKATTGRKEIFRRSDFASWVLLGGETLVRLENN